jgi:hypothetical protein
MPCQKCRRRSLATGSSLIACAISAAMAEEVAAYSPLNYVIVNSFQSHFSSGGFAYDRIFSGPPTQYINDITPPGASAGGATYAWTYDPSGSPDGIFSVMFLSSPSSSVITGSGSWSVTLTRRVWFFDEGQYEAGYEGVEWSIGGSSLGISGILGPGTYTFDWTLTSPSSGHSLYMVGLVFGPASVPLPMAPMLGLAGLAWLNRTTLKRSRVARRA